MQQTHSCPGRTCTDGSGHIRRSCETASTRTTVGFSRSTVYGQTRWRRSIGREADRSALDFLLRAAERRSSRPELFTYGCGPTLGVEPVMPEQSHAHPLHAEAQARRV